jgi:SAM-dependent methyltransferase
MINSAFAPNDAYFNHLRFELLNLARGTPERVLDIGCATGAVLEYFVKRGARFAAGVELVPEVAEAARSRLGVDVVLTGSVESIEFPFPQQSFDLIVAGHVLEHVTDPWQVLTRLVQLLKPGGQFIGSLPNVRCIKVSLPLLFRGKWEYAAEGILDRTHFRFFTKRTIVELIESSGLALDEIHGQTSPTGKLWLVNKLSLGAAIDLCAYTYNFSATKR